MKIGMIFECGPQGADKKVCEYLARQIRSDLQIESVTLDNKPNLIIYCGEATAQLLKQDCDHILIIWDLYPAWREKKTKPCLKEDRESIYKSLQDAKVDLNKISLICITEELEAWLIADGRAISSVLSTLSHPVTIKDRKNSERTKNPKKVLNKYFQEKLHKPYNDRHDAEKIVRAMPDLTKIRKCESFTRFQTKITLEN